MPGHNADRGSEWRGVNHLALVTPDLDATVRFYHGLLDMPIVWTVVVGSIRHYFFEAGPEHTVAFRDRSVDEIASEDPAGQTGVPAHLDHLAFNLADEDALESLRDRLRAAGVECTDVVDHHGMVRSVHFTDPNGIALEASYWVAAATGRDIDYGDVSVFDDKSFFGDPDPVPAVRELMETGELSWMQDSARDDGGTDIA